MLSVFLSNEQNGLNIVNVNRDIEICIYLQILKKFF